MSECHKERVSKFRSLELSCNNIFTVCLAITVHFEKDFCFSFECALTSATVIHVVVVYDLTYSRFSVNITPSIYLYLFLVFKRHFPFITGTKCLCMLILQNGAALRLMLSRRWATMFWRDTHFSSTAGRLSDDKFTNGVIGFIF